jgi:hypothetical protein
MNFLIMKEQINYAKMIIKVFRKILCELIYKCNLLSLELENVGFDLDKNLLIMEKGLKEKMEFIIKYRQNSNRPILLGTLFL